MSGQDYRIVDHLAVEAAKRLVAGELNEVRGHVLSAVRQEAVRVLRYADSAANDLAVRGIILDTDGKIEVLEDGVEIRIRWRIKGIEMYKSRAEMGIRSMLAGKDLRQIIKMIADTDLEDSPPDLLIKKYREARKSGGE